MRVDILCGGEVIGSAMLAPIDPPMGVAEGAFEPNALFEPTRHVYRISSVDAEYNNVEPYPGLTARSDLLGDIDCCAVAIDGWSDGGATQFSVCILGMWSEPYRAAFSSHEMYKKYFRGSET